MNANRSTYLTAAMANLARDSWGLRRRNVRSWQQNTATRRLTTEMLDAVFLRARELLGDQNGQRPDPGGSGR